MLLDGTLCAAARILAGLSRERTRGSGVPERKRPGAI